MKWQKGVQYLHIQYILFQCLDAILHTLVVTSDYSSSCSISIVSNQFADCDL